MDSQADSGSKCVAAAISKLAFWQSGMKSWCVCDGGCITDLIDVVFCQGKLYYTCSVACRECTTDLFAFEISEDNNGLMVSRVDGSVVELPVVTDNYDNAWSIVEWRGKLQLVATYYGDAEFRHIIVEVRLFEADLSTNPVSH